MYPKLPFLLLPYTRLELPGWGKLLGLTRVLGSRYDDRWNAAPTKIIKGKWHGYRMKLDLSDWSERLTYFLGRYYETGVQHLLSCILEPGDRFIDVGANIGMIALHAAYLVTENGEVECFEPNPECIASIKDNLDRNGIKHIIVHPVGLSDNKSILNLNLTSTHTGTATLAPTGTDGIVKSFEVQVLVGDDVVLSNPKQVKFIKIDVEGFEFHVLKGLKRTLDTFHPLLITEFSEAHFHRAGTSATEIERFLRGNGYIPFGITTHRKLFKHHLQLVPIEKGFKDFNFEDIFWAHHLNPPIGKVERYICRQGSV